MRGLRDGARSVRVLPGFLWGLSYVFLFEAFSRGRVSIVSPLVATESLVGVAPRGAAARAGPSSSAATCWIGAALIVTGGALIGAFR